MCRQIEGVAMDAPRLFVELVKTLRHLSFDQMWTTVEDREWGPER